MSDLPLYTLDEVSKHKDRSNCWIIIEGHVYDVGRFLDEHPGGEEVMLELAGMDATEGFDQIGHSDDARDLLKTMLIGHLDATAPAAQPAQPAQEPPKNVDAKESGGVISS
jgi:cytochrome b involved in lipid metabolism